MTAYYNEIDPYAAQWLRNLINAGHIAPGYVDERSIEDVFPSDLRGFTQCHFFAGIGVWSLALRNAGWSDDRPVWTGSCPCQPFSTAGQGAGFDDERHLWPAFHHLIKECKPPNVFGEQVASKDADTWIDLVSSDLEALGYAFGAVPFPSASVGAPHIRDRLYWVADTECEQRGAIRLCRHQQAVCKDGSKQAAEPAGDCGVGGMGHASGKRLAQRVGEPGISGWSAGRNQGEAAERTGVHTGGMADTEQHDSGREAQPTDYLWEKADRPANQHSGHSCASAARSGPTNGHWRAADWLLCRDGKWRPVEPGTSPLAHGSTARVGRLRDYGNAINAIQAQVFIESVMEINGAMAA